MEQRLSYVKVTNNFDTPYVDMFDGIPVIIDPGGSQNIRPEQAFHFFGYVEGASKQSMVRHTSIRRGWNGTEYQQKDESGVTLMERLFDKLKIEPVTFKLVEEEPDTAASIPAEPEPGDEEQDIERAAPPPKFKPVPTRAKPSAKKSDE